MPACAKNAEVSSESSRPLNPTMKSCPSTLRASSWVDIDSRFYSLGEDLQRQDDRDEGKARSEREMGRFEKEILGLNEERTPGVVADRRADSQEGERGLGEKR